MMESSSVNLVSNVLNIVEKKDYKMESLACNLEMKDCTKVLQLVIDSSAMRDCMMDSLENKKAMSENTKDSLASKDLSGSMRLVNNLDLLLDIWDSLASKMETRESKMNLVNTMDLLDCNSAMLANNVEMLDYKSLMLVNMKGMSDCMMEKLKLRACNSDSMANKREKPTASVGNKETFRQVNLDFLDSVTSLATFPKHLTEHLAKN
jgi:hypothetical protein